MEDVIILEVRTGANINDVAKEMIDKSYETSKVVQATFNDIVLSCSYIDRDEELSWEDIVDEYLVKSNKRNNEFERMKDIKKSNKEVAEYLAGEILDDILNEIGIDIKDMSKEKECYDIVKSRLNRFAENIVKNVMESEDARKN